MKHIYNHPQFLQQLSPYVEKQRWYRNKPQKIKQLQIEDVISISSKSFIFICSVYPQKKIYIIPLEITAAKKQNQCIFVCEETGHFIYEGCQSELFCGDLWNVIIGKKIPSAKGHLCINRLSQIDAPKNIDFLLQQGEQSNTNIVFNQKWLLKIFRQPEYGINPDLEINLYLSKNNFQHAPKTIASLCYQSEEGYSLDLGILQDFIFDACDGWEYAISLANNYLSDQTSMDSAMCFAELIGKRTAELHMALVGEDDFSCEKMTKNDSSKLFKNFSFVLDEVCELLQNKSFLYVEDEIKTFLKYKKLLLEKMAFFLDLGMKIRCHGDYHLGQLLKIKDDIIILDFEGEPMRSLAERRQRHSPFKDVAGMMRSFHYAIFKVAMDKEIENLNNAKLWAEEISFSFLNSYLNVAKKEIFLPDPKQQQNLLQLFLIDKALYELKYELTNRPSWVHIPLYGILSLLKDIS